MRPYLTRLCINHQIYVFIPELVRLTIKRAQIPSAKQNVGKRYFCTVSIGKQCVISDDVVVREANNDALEWNSSSEFVLHRGGASMVRIAVFRRGAFEGAIKNQLVGFTEIDLNPLIDACGSVESDSENVGIGTLEDSFDILDPVGKEVVGSIQLLGASSSIHHLEQQMWEHLLLLADWNETKKLTFEEFRLLMNTYGGEASKSDLWDVFERARSSSSDPESPDVEIPSIAYSLSQVEHADLMHLFLPFCPVDGAVLSEKPEDRASNVLYVWLALASTEAGKESNMKSGYMTEAEAARSWALKLSEWASHPVRRKKKSKTKLEGASISLESLRATQHILVYDRSRCRIIEEIVSPVILVAMRTMYQSRMGRKFLSNERFLKKLTDLSIHEGEYRDSPESAEEIHRFVESFMGQVDIESADRPISEYKTFNEFFYRKLKDGARPIANSGDSNIIVSAADCRLQVYDNVDQATRFWVKGRNFSIIGLLGDPAETISKQFYQGSLAIFRLAPQDYHRFHSPISGKIVSIADIPGKLLTVNPIAVNSIYCDVFTVNKRSVMMIDSKKYGRVAFIAIGATLVGTIRWTAQPGESISKGDELGYFAFGGSTCIALFQPDCAVWDQDLVENSQKSLETLVQVGERIGCSKTHVDKPEHISHAAEMADIARRKAESAGILEIEERPNMFAEDSTK